MRSEPFIELSDNPELGERMFGEAEATLRLGVRGKGKLVAYYENICAVVDSLEVCKNLAEDMDVLTFDKAAELINVVTGLEVSAEEVAQVGERIVNIERAYIVREGVRRSSDTLPKRFLEEPVRKGPSAGHVIELSRMLDEYYRVRGWDLESGVPTEAKLRELGLQNVAEDLRKHGVNLK